MFIRYSNDDGGSFINVNTWDLVTSRSSGRWSFARMVLSGYSGGERYIEYEATLDYAEDKKLRDYLGVSDDEHSND